jgi:hypothetical protein
MTLGPATDLYIFARDTKVAVPNNPNIHQMKARLQNELKDYIRHLAQTNVLRNNFRTKNNLGRLDLDLL